MTLFSETFQPGLFALLRADSDDALQAAQTKLDTALKVFLITNSMRLLKVPVVGRPDFSSAWHPLQLGMFLTSPTHKFAG